MNAPFTKRAAPMEPELPAAARAFDGVAPAYDARFGAWASVAAQRRAVRRALICAFPPGSRLLELGAGTGEDALFLAARGYEVLATDGAPAMIRTIEKKATAAGLQGVEARQVALEDLGRFAATWRREGSAPLAGVYSNFASLNCIRELRPVAAALAQIVVPGARCLLVVFGPFPPGEVVTELLRGRPRAGFRRLARGAVRASVAGRGFDVWYHRPREIVRAFGPEFRLVRKLGIGICVPPSAAEPAISLRPTLLAALETIDRAVARPLALLGDHLLFDFRRSDTPVGERG